MREIEKILEEIDELHGKVGSECTSEDHFAKKAWEYCLKCVEEIIRKHLSRENGSEITRQSRDREDDWITVNERLPIPNKEVWVTVKRNGKVFVSTDAVTEKGHFWNYEKENILAWREKDLIPEPYRPERSDNHYGE